MAEYTQYKVNELKDILRQRNLSLSGTKSELIQRLQEHDASGGSAEEAPAAEAPAAEEPAAESAEKEESAPEASENTEAASEKPAAAETSESVDPSESKDDIAAPEAPKLSDDEFLAKVKEDLEQQIKRAQRFGGESAELEARLKRIMKFGVSAVRDAAEKASSKLDDRKKFNRSRKGGKKFRRGPKPATA